MSLKNIAIGLNVLLMLLCFGFFAGHGLPKSLMLWTSAAISVAATAGAVTDTFRPPIPIAPISPLSVKLRLMFQS